MQAEGIMLMLQKQAHKKEESSSDLTLLVLSGITWTSFCFIIFA